MIIFECGTFSFYYSCTGGGTHQDGNELRGFCGELIVFLPLSGLVYRLTGLFGGVWVTGTMLTFGKILVLFFEVVVFNGSSAAKNLSPSGTSMMDSPLLRADPFSPLY